MIKSIAATVTVGICVQFSLTDDFDRIPLVRNVEIAKNANFQCESVCTASVSIEKVLKSMWSCPSQPSKFQVHHLTNNSYTRTPRLITKVQLLDGACIHRGLRDRNTYCILLPNC